MHADRPETVARLVAAFALLIGIGALISPRTLVRLYGADPGGITGIGSLGWKLFAIRNIGTSCLALTGSRDARALIVALQVPDFILFASCWRDRSIPRLTSGMAMCSAAFVGLAGAWASSQAAAGG